MYISSINVFGFQFSYKPLLICSTSVVVTHECICYCKKVWDAMGQIPSCFEPHYDSKAKCKVFIIKISFSFIIMQTKLIFILKALHFASLS